MTYFVNIQVYFKGNGHQGIIISKDSFIWSSSSNRFLPATLPPSFPFLCQIIHRILPSSSFIPKLLAPHFTCSAQFWSAMFPSPRVYFFPGDMKNCTTASFGLISSSHYRTSKFTTSLQYTLVCLSRGNH